MPHPQPESELNGAMLIDKPAGPTSHDIVDIVRNLFRIKKVGHCGTLDPAATGLLILLLGRATKLSQKLTADDKVYEGAITFGGTATRCRFAWRPSLAAGHVLDGLAVIEEPTATTLVPPGWRATVGAAGALVLERSEPL